jgi:integrase
MFNFAVERSILEHSPFYGVKPLTKRTPKTRHLNAKEIKTFWTALDGPDLIMSDEIRRALKLVLVTGQRPGECIGIHWEEISGHWWTIPAERAKNGREHRVYLSDLSLEILGPHGEGLRFPSPRGDKAIEGNALPRSLRRNFEKDKEGNQRLLLEHFTPHDLRRTMATNLAGMGFSGELVGKVLNHVDRSVTAIYNQHHYDREKQQALEAWERKLRAIVTGEKVENVVDFKVS